MNRIFAGCWLSMYKWQHTATGCVPKSFVYSLMLSVWLYVYQYQDRISKTTMPKRGTYTLFIYWFCNYFTNLDEMRDFFCLKIAINKFSNVQKIIVLANKFNSPDVYSIEVYRYKMRCFYMNSCECISVHIFVLVRQLVLCVCRCVQNHSLFCSMFLLTFLSVCTIAHILLPVYIHLVGSVTLAFMSLSCSQQTYLHL